MDSQDTTYEMGYAAAIALLAFYVGDRWGMLASTHRNLVDGLSEELGPSLIYDILLEPFRMSFEGVPVILGLTLFVGVWYAFTYFASERRRVRTAHEHGSARRGTLAEGRPYADRKNPANNIILSGNLSLAVVPNDRVRKLPSARNVCVVGPTGTGKTVGYVLPNILQLCLKGANRDMVVVDPKGTTLAIAGHALIAAGVDVSVLNTQDLTQSDHYNPLAHIRSYKDVMDFVKCLVANTNDGRKSAEPIWDSGEELLYKALLILLLDWFGPSQMTLANLVALIDLVDVADDASDEACPLDLIIDEIETGWRTVADDSEPTERRGAFDRAPESATVRVPSLLERRDGARPAKGLDGRHPGLPNDASVRAWHEFRQGSSRTLRSFVISSHARLGYLTTPEVLDLLAARDGIDELHLDLLGQERNDLGQRLRPRVVFIVSADSSSALQPILAMACWQAVRLPVVAADTRCDGKLPRPLSIVLDEFANIGRIADFERMLSTVRSRNIDIQILVQSLAQLEELFERQGASNVRENAVTTVFLGGANASYSASELSGEFGKTTAYKRETSRQRSDGRESVSCSESSYAADVYEAADLVTLGRNKAIVRIGNEYPIEDTKASFTRHKAYDAKRMADGSKYGFDYAYWKLAGKPRGKFLDAWERVFFGEVKPAREDADTQLARLLDARERLSRARFAAARTAAEADVADGAEEREAAERVRLTKLRVELEEARLKAREAELACARDRAREAAGNKVKAPMSPTEAARLVEAARTLEQELAGSLSEDEARVVLGDEQDAGL